MLLCVLQAECSLLTWPPHVSHAQGQHRGLQVQSPSVRDLPAPLTAEDTAHTYSLLKDYMLSAMQEVNQLKQPHEAVVTDVTDSGMVVR